MNEIALQIYIRVVAERLGSGRSYEMKGKELERIGRVALEAGEAFRVLTIERAGNEEGALGDADKEAVSEGATGRGAAEVVEVITG